MVNAFYPKTLKDALEARKKTAGKSLIICGGSDVMVVHKTAENVIFVNQIEEIQKVELDSGVLKIGAGAVYSDLLKNELIPSILKDAISQNASPAIRNVGTVAGNICNASPAGDTLPVLYALNAKIEVSSLDGSGKVIFRFVPIQDFILGVRKIDLHDDEIASSILIDEKEFSGYSTYYQKVGARQSEAISKASFVGLSKSDAGKISDVKIAFGSVGITVVRFHDLEKEIIGLPCGELKISEIAEKYMERINPIDDQRSTAVYRKTVCKNLLVDFLEGIASGK